MNIRKPWLIALIVVLIVVVGVLIWFFVFRPTTGDISGKVTEADGVTPISGVRVVAVVPDGIYGGEDTTGADGTYLIKDLAPGDNYTVTAEAPGYIPLSWKGVSVVAGKTSSNIDFTLSRLTPPPPPPGAITGKVTLPDGVTPIKGARVLAVKPDGEYGGEDITGANGIYLIKDLPPGDNYTVTASAARYEAKTEKGISIVTGKVTTVNIALKALAGSISGKVTEKDGVTPISGAEVTAFAVDGDFSSAKTGPDGTYIIAELTEGTYDVEAKAARFKSGSLSGVSVTVGKVTTGIDFALSSGGGISGKVTKADKTTPIEGATVVATLEEEVSGSATTAADGTYLIDELVAGTYRVTARAADLLESSKADVVVTAGKVTYGIDFALLGGGSVYGKVTKGDKVTPISGATVRATEPGGGFGSATTGADGAYSIKDLRASDEYIVTVEVEGYPTVSQVDVSVKEGKFVAVSFALSLAGSISGKVTASDGAPISEATVFASEPAIGIASATTAADGTYVIKDLSPSDKYTVAVEAKGYVPASQAGVAVAAGKATSGIDFVLTKGGLVSGMVTESDGITPISDAEVHAVDPGGTVGTATTGADGKYLIENVPASDNVMVKAVAEGYITESITGVRVVTGELTTGVNFALGKVEVAGVAKAGSISGKVTAADGTPISGADVYAEEPSRGVGMTTTGADGTYLLEGLAIPTPPDNYMVVVEAEGYEIAFQDGIEVTEGKVTPNIDFVLSPE